MGFSQKVADEVLVRCRRHCCICDTYAGTKIELHHIKQVADGGEDTVDNCIPLCLNCHAEVKSYNPHHPKGRKFTETELKGHRDKCYAKYDISIPTDIDMEDTEKSIETWIFKHGKNQVPIVTWGISSIDKYCTLLPGTVALIAGYTEMGKSIYAQHVMLNNLKSLNNVIYFHFKESSDALLNNIVAAESMTELSRLQRQLLDEDDWKRISITLSRINFECLKLVPFNEKSNMLEQILFATEKSNANLIIIDDFNALGLHDNSKVEEFLYRLKCVSARTGVIVLILNNIPQNNHRVDRHPIKKDVQYEELYRMCDVVQFLYREEDEYGEDYSKNSIQVIIVKNNGTNNVMTIEIATSSSIPFVCPIADND